MNEITKHVLRKTIEAFPEEAVINGSEFRFQVSENYQAEIKNRFEKVYFKRALRHYRRIAPENFDRSGAARDYEGFIYLRFIALYRRVLRVIYRKIKRDPELSLDNWTDPLELETYQLKMF